MGGSQGMVNAMIEPGNYILRFGMHSGEKLRDVPIEYLDYLLGWDGLRAETRKAIEAYLKTQAEYDQMDDAPDWKEGREDAEDWRKM